MLASIVEVDACIAIFHEARGINSKSSLAVSKAFCGSPFGCEISTSYFHIKHRYVPCIPRTAMHLSARICDSDPEQAQIDVGFQREVNE